MTRYLWIYCLLSSGVLSACASSEERTDDVAGLDGTAGETADVDITAVLPMDARMPTSSDTGLQHDSGERAPDPDAGDAQVNGMIFDAGPQPDISIPSDMSPAPEDEGMPLHGRLNTSCGAPDQALVPVDCTADGDLESQCVFSHHCLCSDGFVCAQGSVVDGVEECAPGDGCIPREADGTRPDSCGQSGEGVEPVDCTQYGDDEAFCVFGDHCACSERFFCRGNVDVQDQRECQPFVECIPRDEGPIGSTRYRCGGVNEGNEPVDCTALGDFRAGCIFSEHCGCSDGFVCEGQDEPGRCRPGQRCAPHGQN